MNQEHNFGGDATVGVGSRLHKVYDSIRKNDYTLKECFENNIEIRNKINKFWKM